MKQSGLWKSQSRSHIASHAEIGILIDCARNQHRNFLFAEDAGEGRRQSWSGLRSRKSNLADYIRVAEAENSLDLIECDALLDSDNVAIIFWTLPKM